MWKKMAGRLFELQSRNGILEEKDRRLYEYAYGVLLGRVVIYLIIVILGIITGNWMEMIVFLLPFTVLRQYAGGIHLEKAGGCMAVSGILVLLCSLYLASAPAVIWQMRIIWFVAVGVIFIMAPVDASSKKLDAKEKKVYGMSCDFDIWYGKEDKNIHREKIEKWRECTNGNVKIEEMAGGHFFVDIEKQCICEMINQKLLEVQ